ncbi:MAG: hypothetical protein HDT46_05280 [Ruminococcaceae bacterium]|nr:hypothetical protein [Oscillospiraceae bacterium]
MIKMIPLTKDQKKDVNKAELPYDKDLEEFFDEVFEKDESIYGSLGVKMRCGYPGDRPTKHLLTENMDMGKMTTQLIERLETELKEKVVNHYNKIVDELNQLQKMNRDLDRQRFLGKVKDSLGMYLYPNEAETVDYPIFYILLYFMEDGERILHITMNKDECPTVQVDQSPSSKAMMYVLERYKGYSALRQDQSTFINLLATILM